MRTLPVILFLCAVLFVAYGKGNRAPTELSRLKRFDYQIVGRQLLQNNFEANTLSREGCDPSTQDCNNQDLSSNTTDLWQAVVVDVSADDDECEDEEIQDAPFDCYIYAQIGLCDVIPEDKCQKSCGRCPCEDILLPGTPDCEVIVDSGLCDNEEIRGKYCQLSCGFCLPPDAGVEECLQASAISCDVSALQSFKNSLERGADILSDWQGDSPCDWDYITCSLVDGESNRVTEVDLRFDGSVNENTMAGKLAPELSKLRFMKNFQFGSQNDITGILHPEYSVLTKLEIFKVYRTGISGSLPVEYSTLTNMKHFTASHNSISGSMPVEYSEWRKLEIFEMGINYLISGNIPDQYSVLIQVSEFYVTSNRISGTLPKGLSMWTRCNKFSVHENQMSGILPVQYSTMTKIQNFKISQNKVTGVLPAQFSTWTSCCENIYVYDNKLTGSLPPQYSTMSDMEQFSASDNRLEGTLPTTYSTMRFITKFLAYNNGIEGSLPPQYSTMAKMDSISVVDNNMSGTLPVQYSTMDSISLFHTYGNLITSTIPDEWSTWPNDADISV